LAIRDEDEDCGLVGRYSVAVHAAPLTRELNVVNFFDRFDCPVQLKHFLSFG
jgi:hypothetical protein